MSNLAIHSEYSSLEEVTSGNGSNLIKIHILNKKLDAFIIPMYGHILKINFRLILPIMFSWVTIGFIKGINV